MRRSIPILLAVALATPLSATSAAAQTPPKTPAAVPAAPRAPAVQYVRVEGVDYMFHIPTTIKPGLTVFNLVNMGQDVHAMTVLVLPANKTMHDFLDAFVPTGKVPSWTPVLGETGTIKPGAEAFVTLRLKPGKYVLACLINAKDGRTHTEVGMVQMVTAK